MDLPTAGHGIPPRTRHLPTAIYRMPKREKTGGQCIKAIIRQRTLLYAGALARQHDGCGSGWHSETRGGRGSGPRPANATNILWRLIRCRVTSKLLEPQMILQRTTANKPSESAQPCSQRLRRIIMERHGTPGGVVKGAER